MPATLHIYNTPDRAVVPFRAADPDRITFYTCGPTVYDDAHIGNLRAFLTADLLRRWLESPLCAVLDDAGTIHRGPRSVIHVLNITDVGHMTEDSVADGGGEDKMQVAARRLEQATADAKKSGTAHAAADIDPADPRQIAAFYTERFIEDARTLGLRVIEDAGTHPERLPRASAHIEGMRAMIESLAERGLAYRVGDAVYFDVQEFSDYGKLSGNTLDMLRGGAGGRVSDEHQQGKRHPADFLLWKSDPTHLMKWPSPAIPDTSSVGGTDTMPDGYPGWHIECSAMSRALLGDEIDLHSGGEDNIFPHHECEIAQSRGVTGRDRFARHWLHVRFLQVEGEKMSKSLGNFFTARDLFGKGHQPAAVRLELIKTHYRSNANFTEQGLRDSARIVERWRRLIDMATPEKGPANKHAAAARADAELRFADALHDDLNIAGAIGAINRWMGAMDAAPTPADADTMRRFDAVLGVLGLDRAESTKTSLGVYLPGVEPSSDIETKLAERAEARKSKDYARSDAIRDELTAMGYAIKDVAGGRVEVGPA